MSSVSTTLAPPAVPPRAPKWDEAAWRVRRRRHHATIFLLSAAVLVAARILDLRGETDVFLPLIDVKLPGLCYWNQWLHVPCPGCGLTRSMIRLAAGDVAGAWHFNPAGLLCGAVLAFQVPYRAVQWRRLGSGRPEWRGGSGVLYLWLFIFALFAQWGWRLLF
jgi:hypothetical protein